MHLNFVTKRVLKDVAFDALKLMIKSPDYVRKLSLYAHNDDFVSHIDLAIVFAFISSNELQVTKLKHIKELANS